MRKYCAHPQVAANAGAGGELARRGTAVQEED